MPFLAQVAAVKRNGLAQWLWQSLTNFPAAPKLEPEKEAVWRAFATRYFLYYDPTVKPQAPQESGLPLRKHFPTRDLVDLRTGWKTDDTFLSFLCDHSPRGGHRQADRGHFSFFSLGESFAIDSGRGSVKLDSGSLRMGAVGAAHNLPLIHGEMQHEMPAKGSLRSGDLNATVPVLEADIGASYRSLRSFKRRAAWLPGAAGEPAWVVIGDLAEWDFEGPALLSWLLHTDVGNRVETDGSRAVLTGARKGHRCLVQVAAAGPGAWRNDEFLGHPRLRYDWFFSPLQCLVLLAPFEKGQPCPVIEHAASADGCALRVQRGGRSYSILSATPKRTLTWGGHTTSAEFAVVAE